MTNARRPKFTRLLAVASAAAVALALAACSGAPGSSSPGNEADSSEPVEAADPQSIAALDYESAEVVASLGLADRLVLVPEAVLNPALGGHIDEMREVPHTIPVAMELDAETVIDLEPELVIMSPRHGADEKIGAVLEGAGVSTLALPTSWSSVDSMTENIEIIGEAVGEAEAAQVLAEEIESGLESAAEPNDEAPRVLILTNQAGRPFVTAGEAMPLEILERAGAQSVSDELGIETTGPMSAEQVLEADPDGILLIDMNGSGEGIFRELLSNDAVASSQAVAHDRVMLVEGREVQALGLQATVDGLEKVTEWVDEIR